MSILLVYYTGKKEYRNIIYPYHYCIIYLYNILYTLD